MSWPDPPLRRRATDFEVIANARSPYDSVECPSLMKSLCPDPPAPCRHHYWLRSEYGQDRVCIDCGARWW